MKADGGRDDLVRDLHRAAGTDRAKAMLREGESKALPGAVESETTALSHETMPRGEDAREEAVVGKTYGRRGEVEEVRERGLVTPPSLVLR